MTYQRILYQSFLWRGLYFASTFLLNILFARYYQASESGWVFFITNSYAFTLLVAGLSLESGMGFFVSKKEIATSKLLNLSVLWSFIVGMVILFSYYLFFIKEQNNFSEELFLVSSLSYVCGILLTNYCSGLFYGNKNFVTPNIICTLCNLALMLFIIASFSYPSSLFNSRNYIFLYFVMFLIQGFLLVIAVKISYATSWQPLFPATGELKKLLRYSLTAFIANVIFFLVYRIDYWFVKSFCSPEDLGNYVQVSKLGQVLITIPSILASAVFSLTAGGQKAEVNEDLQVLSRVLLLSSGLFCLSLALTGKWLFPFVFGASFNRMYLPFLLLTPGILSISALYPLTAYYSGKNMMRVNIAGSLIGLLFIIAFDFILIPRFGIKAAALISSLGYICYHMYVLIFFKKEYKTSISDFFRIKRSDFTWMKSFVFNTFR